MLRSVVMRILILVLVINITVSSMLLVIVMNKMIVKSMRVTQIDQVGRNITRAFWDYYKIVAVIPLEVAAGTRQQKSWWWQMWISFRTHRTTNAGSQRRCPVGQNLPPSPEASTWIGWRRWNGNDSRLRRPLTGRWVQFNKHSSLKATLVWNYDRLTHHMTDVEV